MPRSVRLKLESSALVCVFIIKSDYALICVSSGCATAYLHMPHFYVVALAQT